MALYKMSLNISAIRIFQTMIYHIYVMMVFEKEKSTSHNPMIYMISCGYMIILFYILKNSRSWNFASFVTSSFDNVPIRMMKTHIYCSTYYSMSNIMTMNMNAIWLCEKKIRIFYKSWSRYKLKMSMMANTTSSYCYLMMRYFRKMILKMTTKILIYSRSTKRFHLCCIFWRNMISWK